MSASTRFEHKPIGFGGFIVFLLLTAQYLALALAIVVMIKGTSVLDPVAPVAQDLMAWFAKLIGTTPAAP
ncbi:MAG: hypothetical protein JSR78_09750 [Proteobacteria bacterium]|nr:hypothetical protein [Pseudomonadota bacterium]